MMRQRTIVAPTTMFQLCFKNRTRFHCALTGTRICNHFHCQFFFLTGCIGQLRCRVINRCSLTSSCVATADLKIIRKITGFNDFPKKKIVERSVHYYFTRTSHNLSQPLTKTFDYSRCCKNCHCNATILN